MNRKRKGFTLIELIVAMSIILILGTITVVGVRSMMQSSRGASTRVALQSAESIFDEWRRSAGAAGRYPSQAWPAAILPGSLNSDDPNNYRATKTVRLTRGMMFRMNQSPAIRKLIQALPADRLLTFEQINNASPWGTYSNLSDPTHLEVQEPPATGSLYISYYVQPTTDYPAIVAPGSAQWPNFWLQTTNQTPILVDAWNNPIIFFPSCGFIVGTELHTSHGVFAIPTPGINWVDTATYAVGDFVIFAGGDGIFHLYRCINAHAASDANRPNTGTGNWEQIPTRPFFASAGPDGVLAIDPGADNTFGTADDVDGLQDNLYSYER